MSNQKRNIPSKLELKLVAKQATIEQMIRNHVIDVLRFTNGNMTAASRLLGINRRSLQRRMDTYNKPCCLNCGGHPEHSYSCKPYGVSL